MKIVVIGGGGLVGKKLVTSLHERGHEAVAASPSSGVNAVTGEGLADVLVDAEVVVDVMNSPSFEDCSGVGVLREVIPEPARGRGRRWCGSSRCAINCRLRSHP